MLTNFDASYCYALGYTAGDVLYTGSAFFISIVPVPVLSVPVLSSQFPRLCVADSMIAILNRMIFCPVFQPSYSSVTDSYVVTTT